MPDARDRGLRGVLGGLLALLLVGGTVVASAVIAFAEMGASRPATASATAGATVPPTPVPSTPTAAGPAPTVSLPPSPSATLAPTIAASRPASATPASPQPSETATAVSLPTASPMPTLEATACVPAPPVGWTIYVIQPGDTLFSLSVQFGASQSALQQANCIANPSEIRAGGRIYAPARVVASPATSGPGTTPTVPSDIPTITSVPIPTATPACVPPEFFDPLLNRCRLPDS